MTENLLHKLEEKMMTLLGDIEDSRKHIQRLQLENNALRTEVDVQRGERERQARKLQDLISILDTVGEGEGDSSSSAGSITSNAIMSQVKPVLVQQS